MFFCLVLCMTW